MVAGQTNDARVLMIVYIMREDLVRVVTAFEASSRSHYIPTEATPRSP